MKKILTKILDEINKETPRLDYIRGLIEASIEEETSDPFINAAIKFGKVGTLSKKDSDELNNIKSDEETIPEIAKVGRVGNIA